VSRLDEKLAALTLMSPPQLRSEWVRVWKSPAPRFTPDLLRLGIAYKLQQRSADRKAAVEADTQNSAGKSSCGAIARGTQFIRNWNGQTIIAIAEDQGFRFGDRIYPSLTAVATQVTGTHWSGPRFFGLTGGHAR